MVFVFWGWAYVNKHACLSLPSPECKGQDLKIEDMSLKIKSKQEKKWMQRERGQDTLRTVYMNNTFVPFHKKVF